MPELKKLGRAVIARGRTIAVPHPTKRKIVNHTPEGKPIEQAELMHFGPGQEIELPGDEIVRLRKLGYLTDPSASEPPVPQGARVLNEESGASVSAL